MDREGEPALKKRFLGQLKPCQISLTLPRPFLSPGSSVITDSSGIAEELACVSVSSAKSLPKPEQTGLDGAWK